MRLDAFQHRQRDTYFFQRAPACLYSVNKARWYCGILGFPFGLRNTRAKLALAKLFVDAETPAFLCCTVRIVHAYPYDCPCQWWSSISKRLRPPGSIATYQVLFRSDETQRYLDLSPVRS